MLRGMTKTHQKSPSEPLERRDRHERDDSADMDRDTIALPSHVAGSGTLDRLVETARDYARHAASENTLKAYAKDWAQFTRWCRMRGADPLPFRSHPSKGASRVLAGATRSAASRWTARIAISSLC